MVRRRRPAGERGGSVKRRGEFTAAGHTFPMRSECAGRHAVHYTRPCAAGPHSLFFIFGFARSAGSA